MQEYSVFETLGIKTKYKKIYQQSHKNRAVNSNEFNDNRHM